jgi:hypothetical protein
MPQLWTETIVTQYFWLVTILLGFYYLAVSQIIPQIAFTLKTRKELEANSTTHTNIGQNLNTGNSDSINNTKLLLSNILAPISYTQTNTAVEHPQLKSSISSVRADWVKKHSN